MNTCRKYLKKARVSQGLTLEKSAELSNISKQYLWELEKGVKNNPSIKVLKILSEIYKVNFLELINGDNSENKCVSLFNLYKSLDTKEDKKKFKEFIEIMNLKYKLVRD